MMSTVVKISRSTSLLESLSYMPLLLKLSVSAAGACSVMTKLLL